MKRAAIYARFSTDLQNERSIEDQIALCRDYTSREGMNVVEVYEDKARSGGSVMGRGGLLPLLDEARDQSFDVVVVEALDRLSRDMEDLAGIHKRLSFLGIEIRAVHEGVVNTVLVGLRGLVRQLYREDNAHKVRGGLAGRVSQGLNAGGRAYGYVPVVGDKGKRVIVEGEAEIVRRIFDEYVAGRTPREIAHDQAGAWPYTSKSAAKTAPHAVGSPPMRGLWRRDFHEREGQFRTRSHPLFSRHGKRFLPRRKDFLP
jgi:site-specific DNA recombinase